MLIKQLTVDKPVAFFTKNFHVVFKYPVGLSKLPPDMRTRSLHQGVLRGQAIGRDSSVRSLFFHTGTLYLKSDCSGLFLLHSDDPQDFLCK